MSKPLPIKTPTRSGNPFGDKVFVSGVHTYCLQQRKGFRHDWEERYFTNFADANREKNKAKARHLHAVVQFLDAKGRWIG